MADLKDLKPKREHSTCPLCQQPIVPRPRELVGGRWVSQKPVCGCTRFLYLPLRPLWDWD